jgi:hypothetical protein
VSASLHFTQGPVFSVVEVTALAFVENAEPVLLAIGERTRQEGTRRLLINLMDVVAPSAPNSSARSACSPTTTWATSKGWPPLVPPEKLTRLSEAAARAQGMELRVFCELSEAIGWLVA